ncbi:hypothetical protein V2A60_002243 [Cordyceps javanica]
MAAASITSNLAKARSKPSSNYISATSLMRTSVSITKAPMRPVCSIRLSATYDKMLALRRGGYYLELNSLHAQTFFRAAEHAGPRDLAAILPTQMLLLVETPDTDKYLVDVGLSKYSFSEPLSIWTPSDSPSVIARGIPGTQLRLRRATDSREAEKGNNETKGDYLQVLIPDSGFGFDLTHFPKK